MITRLLLIGVLCVSLAPAAAHDSGQANRLLVEAAKLIQAAGTKQAVTEKLPLMESALAKLNEIVENHPSSDLAVKLITGQHIGHISFAGVTDAIEELRRLRKQDFAKVACLDSLNAADPECREWLYDIGRAQLLAGDPDGAFQTAKLIADASTQQELLRDIADVREARVVRHLRAGNLESALEAAKLIEDAWKRDRAFKVIAQERVELVNEQLRAGNLEDALATAKSIQADDVRAQKLHAVALAQAEMVGNQLQAGNLEGALAAARSIEYLSIRDQAFHAVAEEQAQAGNLGDAQATAEAIESDHLRAQVLDVIRRRTQ